MFKNARRALTAVFAATLVLAGAPAATAATRSAPDPFYSYYAPEVDKNLVGFAEGGVLVAPAHNLKYGSGSGVWAGIMPMA
ncbi:hypothetical protein [Amycolatopsis minnesotensis]|uniref:Uncharacterized protein n=1 Tax=Amycolatopsis minnesotensis TaxID=337894 RepID=A0ABN2QT55_9PSEU